MREYQYFLLCLLSVFFVYVKPELLVLKFNNKYNRFESLDEEDVYKNGKKISDILLKYQWPMCIGSQLTEEEQNQLLTSGNKYLEETFIQKKIQEEVDVNYYVIFIPNCIYELFSIIELFNQQKIRNPLQRNVDEIVLADRNSWAKSNPRKIDLEKVIEQEASASVIRA